MGVDISSRDGEQYFRSNWWFWRPLVAQMEVADPTLFNTVEHWGTNDGDGLRSREDCQAMALALSGMKEQVLAIVTEQEALPDIECKYCDGKGTRFFDGEDTKCNACDGTLKQPHPDKQYPYDWEFTEEWIAFLQKSDGFKIW